jgi:hypothetical protein
MKRLLLTTVLASAAVFAEPADGAAGIDFELTADFAGKYVWRGQNLSDDPVFQSGIAASRGGLTAGVWGNLELTGINANSGEFTEVDYSIDYTRTFPGIDGAEYSIGAIYYDFPGTGVKDTTEVYWGLGLDMPLAPSVTAYHDVDEAEGTYFAFGVSHGAGSIAELWAGMPVGLELAANLGYASGSYNKYYWGTDQAKINDLVLSASFPVSFGGWTVSPALYYVTLLSGDIRDADTYGSESDFFYAVIGLSRTF